MARKPKPWYRKGEKAWYVTLNGRQINLGKDKKQAEKMFYELMARDEPTVRSDSVTVMFDLFLDWCLKYREKRTYEFYLERLTAFARTIPDLRVNKLKPHHVQRWVDTKKSDGHKRGCIKSVERALNWAKKQGYIEVNPIAGMEKPEAVSREVVIREALYEEVLSLCSDQQFHDLLVFSWETGARPQETLAAEARHFEPKLSRLHFPKHEAKGKKRPRSIYLPDGSFKIVKRLVSEYPAGRLFRNAKGQAWHRNNVNCRFERMKKHINQKLCLYNFRHSFGTRMLESGTDSLTVAALMGHSDLSMLGRVYAHLLQNPENLLAQLKNAS